MTLPKDYPEVQPKNLVFLFAIAHQIDIQGKRLAKNLDATRHVYYAYATLDSLNSSYSMYKYFFDLYFRGSADEMHDSMLTLEGMLGITLGSVFLIGFSVLACYFEKRKENDYKKKFATLWPYVRDEIRGLKNTYKGWRSTIIALGLLGFSNLSYLIVPGSLVLGLLLVVNRYFTRAIPDERKALQTYNASLLVRLRSLPLTLEAVENLLNKTPIHYQSSITCCIGFLTAIFGGAVDSLYLYMAVLSLSVLTPLVLLTLSSLCGLYSLACVMSRLGEEYEEQAKMMALQTKCLVVISAKKIQSLYAQLLEEGHVNWLFVEDFKKTELIRLIEQFEQERLMLQRQSTRSCFSAILLGIKNGLGAYSVASSFLFLVNAFLVLANLTFPSFFVVFSVSLGVLLLVGFAAHAVITNKDYQKTLVNPANEASYQKLLKIKGALIENRAQALAMTNAQMEESLERCVAIPNGPVYFIQEWLEVFRSLFSGFSKGQKAVDFVANPLQKKGIDGHYHDTPFMHVLGAISALLFGFIFALRALAKGLGKTPAIESNHLTTAQLVIEPAIMEKKEAYIPAPLMTRGFFFVKKTSKPLTRCCEKNPPSNSYETLTQIQLRV